MTASLKLLKNDNWPLQLKIGDTIGVFAPASPFNLKRFKEGQEILKKIGFKLKIAQNVYNKHLLKDYLAGSNAEKLADINNLMSDVEVKALIAARGGYGSANLLKHISWEKFPAKALIGFSDITALHLAKYKKTGLISYHGPVLSSLPDLTEEGEENFKNFILNPETFSWSFPKENILKKGQVEGILLGGNLTVLISLLPSMSLPSFEKAILLIEDVGEKGYKLDRLLNSLKESYIWPKVSALIFGSFKNCGEKSFVKMLLEELIKDFKGPVLWEAPFGHGSINKPWPLGAKAFLNCL